MTEVRGSPASPEGSKSGVYGHPWIGGWEGKPREGGQAKAREQRSAKQVFSAGSQLRLAYIKDAERERCPASPGHLDINTPYSPEAKH